MNLRRLEYFVAVVDHGTVTAAADALYVAQPALSRQLKVLERELGVEVFTPRAGRLHLTPAGAALVPLARAVLTRAARLAAAATDVASGGVERLIVSATPTSMRAVVTPFIVTITRDDPLLLTRSLTHFDVDESLNLGADLAISPTIPSGRWERLALCSAPLLAWLHRDHPLAADGAGRPIPLTELLAHDLLLHTHASVSRPLLDREVLVSRRTYARVEESDDGLTLLALASAGRGIAVSTDNVDALGTGVLVARPILGVEGSLLTLPLHAAWAREHYARDVIADLARRMRDHHEAVTQALAPT